MAKEEQDLTIQSLKNTIKSEIHNPSNGFENRQTGEWITEGFESVHRERQRAGFELRMRRKKYMLKNIKCTIHRGAKSRPRDEKRSGGNRRYSRNIRRCRHIDEKTWQECSNGNGNKVRKDERKHPPSVRDLFCKKTDEETRIGKCRHIDEKTWQKCSDSKDNKIRKDERKHSPSARDLFCKKMDEERRALWFEEEKRRNALMEEEERHSRKRQKEDETRRKEQAENEERQRIKFCSEIKETVNNTIEEKMREVIGEVVPQIMAAVSKKKKISR